MTDLAFATATELLDLFQRKKASPAEAAAAAFAQIDRHEKALNCFVVVDREGATASAHEAEARWAAGAPKGLLDGVPVTVKDLVDMKGVPTRRGSRLTPEAPAAEDGPAAARLREAGAVILGKTTTPEFGWKALGDSPLTGVTKNPWDTGRTPGGSSAGAAAGLAAGFGALAVGTDGGGSIRIPSSFCGLFGIKATFGRVPAWPLSPMGLLANIGPMARSADDLALMLTVIGGRDPRDPYALPQPADWRDGLDGGINGRKVAFSPTLGYATVDPEVARLVAAAVACAAELGADVEEVDPGFSNPRDAFNVLWQSGAARAASAYSEPPGDPGLAQVVARGRTFSATDYLDADAARSALGHRMALFHERYDLLLTPTMPVPALSLGEGDHPDWIDWTPFSYPFNMTRQPAATVPCGLTKAGLPVGLQIVGKLYDDALVLRAAKSLEAFLPQRRPELAA